METYAQINKKIKYLIILFSIFGNKVLSQTIRNSYITQDTISIKKPIIISVKGYDGKFVLSEDDIAEITNIKNALKKQKMFLYNDDGFGFITTKDRKKNNISIGECQYLSNEEKGKLIIWKLPFENNKFYLGFVKLSYYNKKIITTNNQKVYLKNSEEFKPILFPICN